MPRLRSLLISVILGLVLAGPLTALVVVSLPDGWRIPAVPYLTASVTIAVIVAIRWDGKPPA
jgi:hypothetical protein